MMGKRQLPPQAERAKLPVGALATRQWRQFFAEVMACDPGEAMRVAIDVDKARGHYCESQRFVITRWAQRCGVRVSTHLIDGWIYVTPRNEYSQRKGPQFSANQFVMPQRKAAS